MGDQPIQENYRQLMQGLAQGIDEILNGEGMPPEKRSTGFVLLVFPFGEEQGPRCNYISNANRKDILVLLKEMVARFEGQPEIEGRA